MKIKSPFDASFKRIPDAAFKWQYQDSKVNAAYISWVMQCQFNLAIFDDFLQEDGWEASPSAKENRAMLIQRRAQALEAFKVGNTELAFAWINFLYAVMRASKRQDFLLPLSRVGKKFSAGRKRGTVSPARGFVREYLRKHPKSDPAKIFSALTVANLQEVRTGETQSGEKYVYTPGVGKMSYRQFSNMVHTERKLQGLIPKK